MIDVSKSSEHITRNHMFGCRDTSIHMKCASSLSVLRLRAAPRSMLDPISHEIRRWSGSARHQMF